MTDNSSSRARGRGKANAGSFTTPTAYELWAPAVAGALKWNGTIYEGWAMLGSEWLDFVNRRLKADLSLPQRVCACRSPDEIRDVCTAFWQQAADDYQKEFAAMAKLGSGFVNHTLTATQARIDEVAREAQQSFAQAA